MNAKKERIHQELHDHLDPTLQQHFKHLHVFQTLPSTHQWLLQQPSDSPLHQEGGCVLALEQTQGVGRRGALWQHPANNLALSIAFCVDQPVIAPQFMLALAVAWRDRLASACPEQALFLKWPNDLYSKQGKIGGLMAEQPHHDLLILSVGLNRNLPEACPNADVWQGDLSLSEVTASLLKGTLEAWNTFQQEGLAPFAVRWSQHDLLLGRSVVFQTPQGAREGRVLGLCEQGGLRVMEADQVVCHPVAWSLCLKRV